MAPPKTPEPDRREPSSASWQTRYRVERELGEGASGRVVLAHDTRLNRHVALKMLAPELLSSARMKKRFLREAQALAGLDHPHVLKVLDILEEEGATVLVLEYAPEGTLEKRLEQGPLPLAEAVAMTKGLLLGLEALHGQGLVHRDVKPANVLLGAGGVPKVADLGIAQDAGQSRMTKKGARLGTPEYMSPEQVQDQELDGRSDVYAAGIMLFELLTGQLPYEAPNEFAVLAWHVSGSVAWERGAGRVPEALKGVIGRALAKRRDERYSSAAEFAQALEAAANRRDADVAPVPAQRVPSPNRRAVGAAMLWVKGRELGTSWLPLAFGTEARPWARAAGVTFTCVLAGGVGMMVGRKGRPDMEGAKAESTAALTTAKSKTAPPSLPARSCETPGPGRTDCGRGNESCCKSLAVPGGRFAIAYDGVDAKDSSHQATVSPFRLDRYEVTVGRFRRFTQALAEGWRPKDGDGKHQHLNDGKGLSDGQGGFETGWTWSGAAMQNASSAPSTPDGGIAGVIRAMDAGMQPAEPPARFKRSRRAARGHAELGSFGFSFECNSRYATWTEVPGAGEKQPINCVTWYQAYAFCIWDGGFLPSEAEWNFAASAGNENRLYPWGGSIDGTRASFMCMGDGKSECSVEDLLPVGSKPAGNGKWGQADLAGNVPEWTLDAYGDLKAECIDCTNTTEDAARVLRGGSFGDPESELRASSRKRYSPESRMRFDPGSRYPFGFRCARYPE